MDAGSAAVAALQLVIPVLFAWQAYKSNHWCRRYEQQLERMHRSYLESIARLHGIPLIENETTDELFARMQRLQQWRNDGLTPPNSGGMDKP